MNYEATTLLKDDQQILHRLMLLRCAVDIDVSGSPRLKIRAKISCKDCDPMKIEELQLELSSVQV